MIQLLLRCHGFFKVLDIFSSTATLSTFGKGGAKPYPPFPKVKPKWSKTLSFFCEKIEHKNK
jgi:hypothetical protein